MSATDQPRFILTSVAGYSGTGGDGTKWSRVYQVLDRSYCYALVYEGRKRFAEQGVEALNGGDLAWPHGHLSNYWSAGQQNCRCGPCRSKRNSDRRACEARARTRKAA